MDKRKKQTVMHFQCPRCLKKWLGASCWIDPKCGHDPPLRICDYCLGLLCGGRTRGGRDLPGQLFFVFPDSE